MTSGSCLLAKRWARIGQCSFLAVALFAGGCQLTGGAGSGSYGPEAPQGDVYQGFLTLEGGDLSAALELIRTGRREVRGALQTSSGLIADGEGRLRGQTLRLELSYGGECPGRMVLEGDWDQETRIYEGEVEASDCTGKGEGTFRFSGS